MKFGNRIPCEYFVALGAGQCDAGPGTDPWETGSYDLALENAGIENYNMTVYTSVLPPQAVKIDRPEYHHGAVCEAIMAVAKGQQGDHICAGVGTVQVYLGEEHIGGFAAEYEGPASPKRARELLKEDLEGIIKRRWGPHGLDPQPNIRAKDWEYHIKDLVVDDNFGVVLAGLCFVSFIYPEIDD